MRLILFLLLLAGAFALDGAVHGAVQSAPGWVAEAARHVTWIGKTDWQALVLVTLMLGAVFAPSSPTAERVLRLAVACFLLILLTGIAVQLLKHGFGRPRPAHVGELSVWSFAPFGFQSGWNSFPSGHSTTMGALAVMAGRIWPRWTVVAWGVAALVGVSRVLVGAHYPSDVVAGLALGAVLAAWLLDRWAVTAPFSANEGAPQRVVEIPRTFGRLLASLWPRRT